MGSRLGAYPLYECENNISISRTYLACFWPCSLECLLIDSRAPLMLLMSYTFILGMASKNKLFRHLCFRAWIEACQLVGNLGHCIQEFEIRLGETFACPLFVCLQAQHLNEFMLAVIGVAALDTVSSTDIYGIKASFLCWSCLKRKQIGGEAEKVNCSDPTCLDFFTLRPASWWIDHCILESFRARIFWSFRPSLLLVSKCQLPEGSALDSQNMIWSCTWGGLFWHLCFAVKAFLYKQFREGFRYCSWQLWDPRSKRLDNCAKCQK